MRTAVLFVAAVVALGFVISPVLAQRLALVAPTPPAAEMPAEDIVWEERALGDAAAPVTIYEYASLTCGHCAAFHELVLPHVKSELIDTGKARLVYRDFPLNAGAVKAATLARCMPASRFFPFIASVYQTQQSWAHGEDVEGSLVKLAALAGLDETRARACMNHEALELKTVELMREAQMKYRISSTPSFVFYDDKGQQIKEYKPFTDLMDKHFKDPHKH
ncbi:MAG: thioredoxin domain-containing protein [Alphaproteobacteria bacterium]|jgi:protein-disulfide isomerase